MSAYNLYQLAPRSSQIVWQSQSARRFENVANRPQDDNKQVNIHKNIITTFITSGWSPMAVYETNVSIKVASTVL